MTLSPAAAALVSLAREDAAGTLTARLASMPGRCSNGYADIQHGVGAQYLCNCKAATYSVAPDLSAGVTDDEWTVFTLAIRSAVREDDSVHQSDMRRLIRGRVAPKHIGQAYRRAVREGLLFEAAPERSDDELGRNRGRWEPTYSTRPTAAEAS